MQYEGTPVEVLVIEHVPPETLACVIWLKNRRPKEWRDRTQHEVSGQIEHRQTFTIVPGQERPAILEAEIVEPNLNGVNGANGAH